MARELAIQTVAFGRQSPRWPNQPGPLDDWAARRNLRDQRPPTNNRLKKIGKGATIGGFVGGILGTTVQFEDHGIWDMDPRVEVGLIVLGALIGAGYQFFRTRRV